MARDELNDFQVFLELYSDIDIFELNESISFVNRFSTMKAHVKARFIEDFQIAFQKLSDALAVAITRIVKRENHLYLMKAKSAKTLPEILDIHKSILNLYDV